MKAKAAFCIVALASLGLAFLLVDCCSGETQFKESQVTDKHHGAAWTEISTSVDSDGNTHVSTIQHPEEWKLLTDDGWLHCTSGLYEKTELGDTVTATFRKGRWTKLHYLSRATP